MNRHRSLRLLAAGAMSFLLVAGASACGGGGSDDATAKPSLPQVDGTDKDGSSGSIPSFTPDKHSFKKASGSKARFANFLVDDGKPADLDVYWGLDATTGKLATTVPYGEVTKWTTMMIDQDPMLTPSDGSTEVNVAFYLKGETDRDSLIMTKSEKLEKGMLLTYTMGWTEPFSANTSSGSLGVGFEHEAGEAPDGKAWVALNSGGIGGIPGGDFMVLNGPDDCQGLESTEIEGGTANSGSAYVVDPGEMEFTASDANTECAERTDPVKLDLEAGDRYVIYAYGTTKEDRKLLAVKIGE